MFVCSGCCTNFGILRSRGKCEMCGEVASCLDIPSCYVTERPKPKPRPCVALDCKATTDHGGFCDDCDLDARGGYG